jgi:hypothetical protein
LHDGWSYFAPIFSLQSALLSGATAARLFATLSMLVVYMVEMPPYSFIALEAGLCTVASVALQLETWARYHHFRESSTGTAISH